MERHFITTGRVLIALYFLLPGIMKFARWDYHVLLMEKHGMIQIPLLLALAGTIQVIGALLLIINRYTALVALTFACMVLLINVNLHDFWNFSGIEGKHELQNFIKNLGIFAGLLILTGLSWKETFKS